REHGDGERVADETGAQHPLGRKAPDQAPHRQRKDDDAERKPYGQGADGALVEALGVEQDGNQRDRHPVGQPQNEGGLVDAPDVRVLDTAGPAHEVLYYYRVRRTIADLTEASAADVTNPRR